MTFSDEEHRALSLDLHQALACLTNEFQGSGNSGTRALAIAAIRRALLRIHPEEKWKTI